MRERSKYRKYLVTVVVALMATGIVFAAYPLFQSLSVPEHIVSDNVHRYDLSTLTPGESILVLVKGMPIRITHRTDEAISSLSNSESLLIDPDSERSQQPLFAENVIRSIKPEHFIALAVTEYAEEGIMGCSLQPADADDFKYLDFQFNGGYFETCRGAWYDHSGRVYKGSVPSALNLHVPEYRYLSKNVIEIVYSDEW